MLYLAEYSIIKKWKKVNLYVENRRYLAQINIFIEFIKNNNKLTEN